MTAQAPQIRPAAETAARKPVIAMMGEFSAGKSTLTNLLLGGRALPMKVTATQLPPVWLCHGDGPAIRVAMDGVESPIALDDLESVPVAQTRYIRIAQRADVLALCDLIDMPGISDPNMSSEVWERVVPEADCVIWCTHATQAWRQSEAAVWQAMPEALKARSFLLLTRIDKLMTERDRARVMKRVEKETRGLFAARFPISLTEALVAGDDRDRWERSGAEAFTQALIGMLESIGRGAPPPAQPLPGQPPQPLRPVPATPQQAQPAAGAAAPASGPAAFAGAPAPGTGSARPAPPPQAVPMTAPPAGPLAGPPAGPPGVPLDGRMAAPRHPAPPAPLPAASAQPGQARPEARAAPMAPASAGGAGEAPGGAGQVVPTRVRPQRVSARRPARPRPARDEDGSAPG